MMQQPVESKKKLQMPIIVMPTINISRWFLLAFPLSVVGFWLVLHPEIITGNLDKPYMLLAGPALIASILVGWLLVKFFQSIVAACRKLWEAFQDWRTKPGSMFWIIINNFLLVSVSESGNYFNGLLGSNDMYGVLGYSVAFVIDLVAIQCMQARLSASRMRDAMGSRLYQLGVIACAGLSAWANTYTALEHFQAPVGATHLPVFMIVAAPWTGMAFPLLIIFLSFTADYTADQTTSKLDPEAYRIAEENRNLLLRHQRDSLKERKELEGDIDLYNGKIASVKVEREFVLLRWFFPAKYPEIEKIIEQISALYEPQIKALNGQIEALNLSKIEGQPQSNLPEISGQISGQSQGNLPSNLVSISVQSIPQSQGNLNQISAQSLPNLPQDLSSISDQSLVNLMEDYTSISRQSPARLTVNLNSISTQSPRETDPDLSSISPKIEERSGLNLPENSLKKQARITRDLSKIEVKSTLENQEKESVESSNKYAITKKEAALLKRCSVKEIEQGIADGAIREYGNNREKVLVSSLKNFVPSKRKLKIVNG